MPSFEPLNALLREARRFAVLGPMTICCGLVGTEADVAFTSWCVSFSAQRRQSRTSFSAWSTTLLADSSDDSAAAKAFCFETNALVKIRTCSAGLLKFATSSSAPANLVLNSKSSCCASGSPVAAIGEMAAILACQRATARRATAIAESSTAVAGTGGNVQNKGADCCGDSVNGEGGC